MTKRKTQWIWVKWFHLCWIQGTASGILTNPPPHLSPEKAGQNLPGVGWTRYAVIFRLDSGENALSSALCYLTNQAILKIGNETKAQAWSPWSWPTFIGVSSVKALKDTQFKDTLLMMCPKFIFFSWLRHSFHATLYIKASLMLIPSIGTMDICPVFHESESILCYQRVTRRENSYNQIENIKRNGLFLSLNKNKYDF